MPTVDLAAQRALLQLADTDRLADAAAHERESLPELAAIAEGGKIVAELNGRVALAEVEVADLDTAARKLDGEIDSVRQRADRDAQRLASGAAAPKEMENLQHEIDSLARRQGTLEDEALELMERREAADAALSAVKDEIVTVTREVDAATVRRNDRWADLDAELGRLGVQRASLTAGLPADVLAIYERVRGAGKVAAAPLVGDRCTGCGMSLDRVAFDEIRGAAPDALTRCPECGTILVRNPS